MEKYLLSIDQGTTGTKGLLVNKDAKVVQNVYLTHEQFYPEEGWVEHDAMEIWHNIQKIISTAIEKQKIDCSQIESVGIDNQGETAMVWDRNTMMPVYPAIVWSDVRTEGMVRQWAAEDTWKQQIYQKTGLNISSYFSATKIKWIMENVEGVKEGMEAGDIVAGTLDSWLLGMMTGGKTFYTDASTASRTMLYNIHDEEWDEEILSFLGIPKKALPEILESVDDFGDTEPSQLSGLNVPITVGIVDQPAGLYGHLCLDAGESKVTYGTGSFVYMNVGESPIIKEGSNLLSSVIWKKDHTSFYSLDGSVYSAGSSIDWASKQVGLYESVEELQRWSVQWYRDKEYKNEVFYIPSIAGLGAPFWNSNARGVFLGMNSKTNSHTMAKAVLEGIAHRVADVLELLESELGQQIKYINVDGKPTSNPYLMQYQANLLKIPVRVNDEVETTALGVAYLQGEAANWWSASELKENKRKNMITYYPEMPEIEVDIVRSKWKHMTAAIDNLYRV